MIFFFPKNNVSIGTKQANQHSTITFLHPPHPALSRQSKSPSARCQPRVGCSGRGLRFPSASIWRAPDPPRGLAANTLGAMETRGDQRPLQRVPLPTETTARGGAGEAPRQAAGSPGVPKSPLQQRSPCTFPR